MNDNLVKINELIKNRTIQPVYAVMGNKELWNWVLDEYDRIYGKNTDVTYSMKLYFILNPVNNSVCPYGNKKHFRGIWRGFVCRRDCKCTQKKIEQTNLAKYGMISSRTDAVLEKTKQTNREKYGTDWGFQNDNIKKKIKNSIRNNYGVENISQNAEIKQRKIDTCMANYGCEYPAQSVILQEKMREKSLIENGCENPGQAHLGENVKYLKDPELLRELIVTHNAKGAAKIIGCAFSTVYHYHNKFNLGLISDQASIMELEIANWLDELKIIHQKDRLLCKPKELDFYLPDYNLAIEYDGLYWHTESNGKNNNYHFYKTKQCEEKNIQLIHIFEDEWVNKKEICKSIIKGYLNKQDQIIPARKCKFEEIPNKNLREFLNQNHLQGWCKANKAVVLKYDNEIIAAMTFGKPRYNKSIEWELIRLAFKTNTKIIGGTEKLWAYFIKKYNPISVVSYCDRRWFTGKVYQKLGFTRKEEAKPTYWYVNDDVREHRSKYQKHKLVKMGYDANLTEQQITRDIIGLDRIWDCGQTAWIWNKK